MSVTDTLSWLFEHGVAEVSFQKAEDEKIVVQSKHFVLTGGDGNRMNIVHQVVGANVPEVLEKLKKQVDIANEQRVTIATL
jgi:hypothetical protein